MSSAKPFVIVVPGSFCPKGAYDNFLDQLQYYGFDGEALQIPSIGKREGQAPAPMSDDAAHIQAAVHKRFDAGQSVVLVAHSYGGIPATESLKGLTAKERGAGKPAVQRIIYTTAMTPPVGKSLMDLSGDLKVDYLEIPEDGFMYHKNHESSGATNFSSLPKEEATECAKRFEFHSALSFASPLTHDGYKDLPVTYLFATKDLTIPPETQEQQIKHMKDAGANVTEIRFESDHCWPMSVPRSTARKVAQAIDASVQ